MKRKIDACYGRDLVTYANENTNLVYLCSCNPANLGFFWHVLDTNAETCILDNAMSEGDLPQYFSCAVLNSNVYVVGGQHRDAKWSAPHPSTNKVQYFDTTTRKWLQAPTMKAARSLPLVVPLSNKLYVFNGLEDCNSPDQPQPFAEYYDPDPLVNKWSTLPDPPLNGETRIPYLSGRAVYGRDTIILWNQHQFFLFDARHGNWHILQNAPYYSYTALSTAEIYSTNVAVLRDTLYWCSRDLHAFDLAGNKPFDAPVFRFEPDSVTAPPVNMCLFEVTSPFLVATGKEELCLIWTECHVDDFFKVSCTKFQTKTSSCAPLDGMDSHLAMMKTSDYILPGNGLYEYAGVLWQNDDKGEHDHKGGDWKPQISNPQNFLETLACNMYVQSYNTYAQIKGQEIKLVASEGGGFHSSKQEDDDDYELLPLKDFLRDLDLLEYLVLFEEGGLNVDFLKYLNYGDFRDMGIPEDHANKLLGALHPSMQLSTVA